MEPEPSARWLREGQTHEAENTPTALAKAMQCYDRAIASLREQPVERVRRELGIAWMNRGNARQKQTDAAATTDAVQAYDEAIALLSAIDSPDDIALRNTIGAAWMNRGHALHRQGTPAAIAAALDSQNRAVAQLKTLPLGENRSYRINLAAAWMNRAHALLSLTAPDAIAAREAALKAIELTAAEKNTDPVIADVALRAHHSLCFALARQLATVRTTELLAETGDIVDESLALVRHWEKKGAPHFRPIATAIFYFGAQFFHAYQPQFLAEFLLENIDPASAAGALFESDELPAIASAALAQAKADTFNRSLLNPADVRLQQLRQDLDDAEKRLSEIHPPHRQTLESRIVS